MLIAIVWAPHKKSRSCCYCGEGIYTRSILRRAGTQTSLLSPAAFRETGAKAEGGEGALRRPRKDPSKPAGPFPLPAAGGYFPPVVPAGDAEEPAAGGPRPGREGGRGAGPGTPASVTSKLLSPRGQPAGTLDSRRRPNPTSPPSVRPAPTAGPAGRRAPGLAPSRSAPSLSLPAAPPPIRRRGWRLSRRAERPPAQRPAEPGLTRPAPPAQPYRALTVAPQPQPQPGARGDGHLPLLPGRGASGLPARGRPPHRRCGSRERRPRPASWRALPRGGASSPQAPAAAAAAG